MQTMADRDGVIWFDGELVPWREAKIHVLTHTLHYGMGVFEGVRAYKAEQGTAIFRLQAHTDRLFDSAHIMKMNMPFDKKTINEAHRLAVRENGLESAYLRPMCFYGAEGMGLRADNLKTHVMVAAWEWGAYLGKDNLENGIRIRTSSYTRHHVNISMCKAKANGHYINSMLALQEALHDGYDEAMLLDIPAADQIPEGTSLMQHVWNRLIADFCTAVRRGDVAHASVPHLPTLLDGLRAQEVIAAARRSEEERRWVDPREGE